MFEHYCAMGCGNLVLQPGDLCHYCLTSKALEPRPAELPIDETAGVDSTEDSTCELP